MGAKKKYKPSEHFEFELDLAPLLAVMVKLVPVLLVSSAFVQMMVIETELPQAVQQAVQENRDNQDEMANISMTISNKNGVEIIVNNKGDIKTEKVAMLADGKFDLDSINKKLTLIKKTNPQVFKISIYPEGDVGYNEIVKIMDEARRSKDKDTKFPVFDKNHNKNVMTDYMFPDIEFANIMEG